VRRKDAARQVAERAGWAARDVYRVGAGGISPG
jgi:hypothetical protein